MLPDLLRHSHGRELVLPQVPAPALDSPLLGRVAILAEQWKSSTQSRRTITEIAAVDGPAGNDVAIAVSIDSLSRQLAAHDQRFQHLSITGQGAGHRHSDDLPSPYRMCYRNILPSRDRLTIFVLMSYGQYST